MELNKKDITSVASNRVALKYKKTYVLTLLALFIYVLIGVVIDNILFSIITTIGLFGAFLVIIGRVEKETKQLSSDLYNQAKTEGVEIQ